MSVKTKFIKKRTCYIDKTVKIGKNVIIYENNRIMGNTVIEDNVILGPNNYIINGVIREGASITHSYIESAEVGKKCTIGPFARLRPNTMLLDEVHIGNFVEVKNSTLGKGTKSGHLAYIGDSDIGENCNIGCGVIFVNYNGKQKNRTKVGDNCFIGSNANIIAPVNIEDNTYICAGTSVTENINNGDFVIGRVRQEVKKQRAKEYLKTYKEKK